MAIRPWPDDMNSTPSSSPVSAPLAHAAAPVPRPGSSLYYALRSSPPALRPALQMWLQWWHEVSRIPLEVSDAGVAETKLQWWAQEVRDSLAGQPHHPLMQARAALPALAEPSIWPELALWTQQLEGLIHLVHQTRWLDDAALQSRIRELRENGDIVIEKLPEDNVASLEESFRLDEELVCINGVWTVAARTSNR